MTADDPGGTGGAALHRVEWTAHPASTVLEDVGVDHRRGYVAVAEELLHRADVVAPLQEVRREGMAEGVAGDPLVEAGFSSRILHGPLHDALVEVMTAFETARLLPARARGKNPLPSPRSRGGRDLSLDGLRNPHDAKTGPEIIAVDRSSQLELMAQQGHGRLREHGVTVPPALWITDVDLSTLEIDVLDAEHETLQQTQAGAVEEQRNEMGRTSHPAQHAADFLRRHDHRQTRRPRNTHDVLQPRQRIVEHVSVEEE